MALGRTGLAAAPLPGGRVLIAGGSNGSATLASAEIFQLSRQAAPSAPGSVDQPPPKKKCKRKKVRKSAATAKKKKKCRKRGKRR
jgi:hypothetical protein